MVIATSNVNLSDTIPTNNYADSHYVVDTIFTVDWHDIKCKTDTISDNEDDNFDAAADMSDENNAVHMIVARILEIQFTLDGCLM